MEPNVDLFKYLDTKFEVVNTKIEGLEALWKSETAICIPERKELFERVEKLEKWRYILTGASIVIFTALSWVANQTPNLWAFLKSGQK